MYIVIVLVSISKVKVHKSGKEINQRCYTLALTTRCSRRLEIVEEVWCTGTKVNFILLAPRRYEVTSTIGRGTPSFITLAGAHPHVRLIHVCWFWCIVFRFAIMRNVRHVGSSNTALAS